MEGGCNRGREGGRDWEGGLFCHDFGRFFLRQGGEREDVGQRRLVGRGIARQEHEVHDRPAWRRRDDAVGRRDDAVGRAPPAVRHLVESRTQHPADRFAAPPCPRGIAFRLLRGCELRMIGQQWPGPATARTCCRQSLRTGGRTAGQRRRGRGGAADVEAVGSRRPALVAPFHTRNYPPKCPRRSTGERLGCGSRRACGA